MSSLMNIIPAKAQRGIILIFQNIEEEGVLPNVSYENSLYFFDTETRQGHHNKRKLQTNIDKIFNKLLQVNS